MTDIRDKYRIISSGAGWIDKSRRGRIRFDGRDAVSFLQALVSNDVAALEHGRGLYATYLTPQGRMVAELYIFHRGDHLLAVVPTDQAQPLSARFDGLIFSEDVRVSDISSEIAQIAVIGGRASTAIASALALASGQIESLPAFAQAGAGDTFVARTDDAILPSFDIFVPVARRDSLVAQLEQAGAVAIGTDLHEALRIDAARPEFGVDMTSETIPLEAGLLDRGISTSKGCYVGQEVIIRVLHRGGGRVAKRLVTIAFDPAVDSIPEAGTPLHVDGRESGRITSAAWSLHEPRVIALGYVHRDHAEVGQRVSAKIDNRDVSGEVTGFAG